MIEIVRKTEEDLLFTRQQIENIKRHAYKEGFADGEKTCKRSDINYNQSIMVESIKHYGTDSQLTVGIEEMCELSQVLTKWLRRTPISREHLVEEFADVTYMLEQIKYIFLITSKEINDAIWEKQKRQVGRMIEEQKKGIADGK